MNEETQPAESNPIHVRFQRTLLGEIAQLARDTLQNLIDATFSACDDAFFDLANRAKTNAAQAHYFESLRHIRLHRHEVVTDFLTTVQRAVVAIDALTRQESGAQTTPGTDGAPVLELVSHEQAEIDAVRTDMVARARGEWQDELFEIRERLLVIGKPFAENAGPFDPGTLSDAFITATKALEVDVDILTVLLRQFDRRLLMHLDELLDPVNEHLTGAGVLPDMNPLKRRTRKKAARGGTQSSRRTAAGDDEARDLPSAQPETHDGPSLAGIAIPDSDPEMRELAHVLKRLHDGGLRLPMLQPVPISGIGGSSPPLPRDELLSLLGNVQMQLGTDTGDASAAVDIRSAIAAIAANRGQISLAQADEDIINVVAMFFDLILDDRNLPLEIQALVSRLQLPVLKVALRDRSFFTDRKHPARQLINEIAHVGLGWEAGAKSEQEALFRRLSELVEEVLHTSEEGENVFEKCLEELNSFVSRQDHRAAKVEKRTRERAEAQARSTEAREAVRTVLNARLEGAEVTPDITDFLINDWQQVMFQRYLRYGAQGPEWQEATRIVEDLVWAGRPHGGDAAQTRLRELLPDLRRRIAVILNDAGTDIAQGGAVLKQLTAILAKIHAGHPDVAQARPLSAVERQQIDPEQEQKPWEEMTAVERQMVRQQQLLEENLRKVDALETGTWLQYDDLRTGASRRCKLAARLKLGKTSTFVFVNRLGAKVYEKPRKAFAYDLQMGYARVLETRPFFDRTLERITMNLRKMAES